VTLRQVSGGGAESGVGDVVVDGVLDGGESAANVGWGGRLVGFEEGSDRRRHTISTCRADRLLHRHPTGQRRPRPSERDHQPVTNILHLTPAGSRKRLAQHLEMITRKLSAAASPTRDINSVDPTRSVNKS
jgi:hypothetical protein